MTPQEKLVIDYIKQRGSITQREASADLGIDRLASRINDLRKGGVNIVRELGVRHEPARREVPLGAVQDGGEGMTGREKVVQKLQEVIAEAVYPDRPRKFMMPLKLAEDALALLKAQEPIEARLHLCDSCTKLYPECDATADGIEFGCGFGNDNIIGCTAYENRWKAQKPVEPTIGGDADGPCVNWWYQCGKCKEAIDVNDEYCRKCGQAVKWE